MEAQLEFQQYRSITSAPDSKKLANPVYSSYTGCPPEIKTHVNILKKIENYTGDGSDLRGGSGRYFTTKPRSIVLHRFRKPNEG
jgi:hypothetical protein